MANEPTRVLLVDDDKDCYRLTRALLAKAGGNRFVLSWADTFDRALEAIRRREHEVYLLDYDLGADDTGLELLREALAGGCSAPFILLTACDDPAVDLEAMKAGAADFLVKGRFDSAQLERSIRYAVERKQSEEALRQKDEQLRHAQKLEAVGVLAGGIAHEFNNLLQVIQGYTEGVMDDHIPQSRRCQDLEQVRQAVRHAVALTRQLLGFSRRQVLCRSYLDANRVIDDMVQMLRPLVGEEIQFDADFGGNVGALYADPGVLQQILLNLCLNARDAMPSGGRLLVKTEDAVLSDDYYRAHPDLPPGRYLLLTVADTGCGMSPEVKARLFEPFFTTKTVGKGTGLGLATAYGLVQQHKGSIHCYSEPGNGTVFRVYLPTVAGPAHDDGGTRESRPIAGGTESVLVAEDDLAVRQLTERVLSEAGYQVLTAADGEEAVRLFEAHADAVSLVVLDVVMPKLSGPAAYDRIRAIRPRVAAVFCSGYVQDMLQDAIAAEPGLRILEKPYDPNALLGAVREALDGYAAGEPRQAIVPRSAPSGDEPIPQEETYSCPEGPALHA